MEFHKKNNKTKKKQRKKKNVCLYICLYIPTCLCENIAMNVNLFFKIDWLIQLPFFNVLFEFFVESLIIFINNFFFVIRFSTTMIIHVFPSIHMEKIRTQNSSNNNIKTKQKDQKEKTSNIKLPKKKHKNQSMFASINIINCIDNLIYTNKNIKFMVDLSS